MTPPARACVELPLRLDSVANLREHWARKARRAKAHRRAALAATGARA